MSITPANLPIWLTWQERPFPDANLLFVDGSRRTLEAPYPREWA